MTVPPPADLSAMSVEVTRVFDAPVHRVWERLRDLPGMAAFSPEVAELSWASADRTSFTATNRRGGQEWTVSGTVLQDDPPALLRWCVSDPGRPSSVWSYELVALDAGRTQVRHAFRHGPGGSLVRAMVEREPDGLERTVAWRTRMLHEDMTASLAAAALELGGA